MEKLLKQKEDLDEEIASGDWIPRSGPSGKQKSPNVIRSAIRKYLAEEGITQTEFLSRIGVNSNSYNRFMTQKYKDEWSATENGTYWSAAQYLARADINSKIKALEEKKSGSAAPKRKADEISAVVNKSSAPAPDSAAAKKAKKAETDKLLEAICAVDVPEDGPIYANCDEVRAWITKFYREIGITDAAFLRCIGAQSNSLNSFRTFKGKGAGASNLVYPRTWRLMEQYRIQQGKSKSANHLEQEKRWGAEGFPRRHDDGKRYVFAGDEDVDPRIYDIEYTQDMRKAYEAKRASEGNPVHQSVVSTAAPVAVPASVPTTAPTPAAAVSSSSTSAAAIAPAAPTISPVLASILRAKEAKAAKDKAAAEKAANSAQAALLADLLPSSRGSRKANMPSTEAELDLMEAALQAAMAQCDKEVEAILGTAGESKSEVKAKPALGKTAALLAAAAAKAASAPKTTTVAATATAVAATTAAVIATIPQAKKAKVAPKSPKSPARTITSFFTKVEKK